MCLYQPKHMRGKRGGNDVGGTAALLGSTPSVSRGRLFGAW